ncbi:MAG: cytochrome c oxidase subunit 3 [Gammaproteobacteria bacterium]|nr:cytochrome c oxidase subunit 3 [Gammaproteobacteria bacterium]
MYITLIFIAGIMVTVIGWLLRQTFNTQPWVATAEDNAVSGASLDANSKTILLAGFLAVATSLFGLFISAYSLRMEMPDWSPLAEPNLLWVNTAMLVLASIAYQWARNVAIEGRTSAVRFGLSIAGLLTVLFLVGQMLAWQRLMSEGAYITGNPANAFFYMLTAVHALHLLGGLWVWARSTIKVWSGAEADTVRLSVELCAVYWHYLLLVWAILFAMLINT